VACVMARGKKRGRVTIDRRRPISVALIERITFERGGLRLGPPSIADCPTRVEVTTMRKLNGRAQCDRAATGEALFYRKRRLSAFALFGFRYKGHARMDVRAELRRHGSYFAAPGLAAAGT